MGDEGDGEYFWVYGDWVVVVDGLGFGDGFFVCDFFFWFMDGCVC